MIYWTEYEMFVWTIYCQYEFNRICKNDDTVNFQLLDTEKVKTSEVEQAKILYYLSTY